MGEEENYLAAGSQIVKPAVEVLSKESFSCPGCGVPLTFERLPQNLCAELNVLSFGGSDGMVIVCDCGFMEY